MSLVHLGTLTLGQATPMALLASANLNASIGLALPSITAKLQGLLEIQASLALSPPTLAAQLAAAIALVENLTLAISLGLPGIDFQFAAVAALLAEVQVDFGAISVSVDFGADFALVLGTGGIDVYVYEGRVEDFGAELATHLEAGLPGGAAPGDTCDAVILAASSTVSAQALATFFRKVA